MHEAVRLVSNHLGLKAGPFEIRPVEDMTERFERASVDVQKTAENKGTRQSMRSILSFRGGSYEGDIRSHIPQRTTGTLRQRATATYRGSKGLGKPTN